MNKIIVALTLISAALSAPAEAHEWSYDTYHRDTYYRSYDTYHRDTYHDHRREHDSSEVILPLVGGVIIGAIIASSQNRDRPHRPDPREYRYDYDCDCYRR